jgi:hypothetical protein
LRFGLRLGRRLGRRVVGRIEPGDLIIGIPIRLLGLGAVAVRNDRRRQIGIVRCRPRADRRCDRVASVRHLGFRPVWRLLEVAFRWLGRTRRGPWRRRLDALLVEHAG